MKRYERPLFFLIPLFGLLCSLLQGQDQGVADSLLLLFHSDSYPGNRMELLKGIAEEETNPAKKLEYANWLLQEASKDSIYEKIYSGYLQKGNALHLLGNFDLALEAYFQSIRYAKRKGSKDEVGVATIAVANIYSEIGNSENAAHYYKNGIEILREMNDSISLASALLNAGDEAFNVKNYTLALEYFRESGLLFEELDYLIGKAYTLGNMGMVYAAQGKDEQAEGNIHTAVKYLESLEDYYGVSVYLTYMSDIYMERNDFPKALAYAERSLELAKGQGLNNQISEANLKLAQLHEKNNDPLTSYLYYKDHILYRDMVKNVEVVQQMADQRTNYEVSQKQIEIDLSEQKRKNQRILSISAGIGLLLVGFMAIGLYRRNRFIQKTKQIIETERDRSEHLLLNILPKETAEELKHTGKVAAKKCDSATVLFTDFKGFTSYSEGLSPEALVETVGFYFSAFDDIVEKYGLEKIKTMGDAYMCAAGLHGDEQDHASRMLEAAFEIASFVEQTKNDVAAHERTFDIRIGINSGPVVAGVVGSKKFAYDIWGDTVNVAARMETMSEAGKINIGEATYALVKDQWRCEYRGEIEAKNRGHLKMYFVLGKT